MRDATCFFFFFIFVAQRAFTHRAKSLRSYVQDLKRPKRKYYRSWTYVPFFFSFFSHFPFYSSYGTRSWRVIIEKKSEQRRRRRRTKGSKILRDGSSSSSDGTARYRFIHLPLNLTLPPSSLGATPLRGDKQRSSYRFRDRRCLPLTRLRTREQSRDISFIKRITRVRCKTRTLDKTLSHIAGFSFYNGILYGRTIVQRRMYARDTI